MDYQSNSTLYDRRPIHKSKSPASRWVREWVPQDVVSNGGKCLLLKWVKMDVLSALKEKPTEQEEQDPEPEENTEVLFLCSYEGCGKTFTDAGALRKHSHIHGERQYACHYEGCTKKFLDSSKLKRHFLIHTGERHFVCPHEGCGKAFSLDFNLRAHMKTHSQENYHICPYQDCGKRYAHEYKLKAHIKTHHEKHQGMDIMKRASTSEKHHSTPKPPAVVYGSASSDRPYACPYEGCEKAYIHEYKLNLHLRREHPGHNMEENGKHPRETDNNIDEGSDQDVYARKTPNKFPKLSKTQVSKMPLSKPTQRKGSTAPATNLTVMQQQWPGKALYNNGEDSEETDSDDDSDSDSDSDSDDEETEDEE